MSTPAAGHRPVLLDVPPHVAAHVAEALRLYRETLAKQYIGTPPELRELMVWMSERASPGQVGPMVDVSLTPGQAQGVEAKTLTYTDAAGRLGCSLRTVKRLVASGDLASVHIGRLARIHIDDIDTYLDSRRATA